MIANRKTIKKINQQQHLNVKSKHKGTPIRKNEKNLEYKKKIIKHIKQKQKRSNLMIEENLP